MTTDVRIDRSRAIDYETIFILRADIDSDASERAISRAVTAIEQGGGKLLKVESWGKRRLAYPIGKQRKGFFVYVRYLGYRGLVSELERNLRMLDTVLRHLTVRLRNDVDPASINVDPDEIKVRRIEITEAPEDEREDSVEASLGLADDQRPERRERRMEESRDDRGAAEAAGGGDGGAAEARGGGDGADGKGADGKGGGGEAKADKGAPQA